MPRQRVVSLRQLDVLLRLMEENRAVVNGRVIGGLLAHQQVNRVWKTIALTLNSIGDGCNKSAAQWKTYWQEQRYRARKKAAHVRHHAQGTGGGPSVSTLTDTEKRILAIMGVNNVSYEGHPRVKIPLSIDDADVPPTTPPVQPSREQSPESQNADAEPAPVQGSEAETEVDSTDGEQPTVKKIPASRRVTVAQVSKLVRWLQQNPMLARPALLKTTYAKQWAMRRWNDIAARLNAAGGAIKSVTGWREYWTDLKLKIRKKGAAALFKISSGMGDTGFEDYLTSLDKKILALDGIQDLGPDCITRDVLAGALPADPLALPAASALPPPLSVTTQPAILTPTESANVSTRQLLEQQRRRRLETQRLATEELRLAVEEQRLAIEQQRLEQGQDLLVTLQRIADALTNQAQPSLPDAP